MKSDDRRAARTAYKERKTIAGIYAVRCRVSGQIWVGQAPNLESVQNRLWFSLRFGRNPHASLQSAWTTHGAASFTVETLEQLRDEDLSYVRDAKTKERLAHWRTKLGAASI
jgi:hypothetical protein